MRVGDLRSEMDQDICLLLSSDPSFFYFTGLEIEHGFLLISKRKVRILVPGFELGRARKECNISAEVSAIRSVKQMKDILKGRHVGLDFDHVNVRAFRKIRRYAAKVSDCSDAVRTARMVKREDEIRKIRRACRETDSIFSSFLKQSKRFRTERDVREFIDAKIGEVGEPAFPTIVASGKNSAMPHHKTGDTRLRGFCVMDFGVRYKGYCSDMTRTVFFGRPSKKQEEDYDSVLKVQEESVRSCTRGAGFSEIDRMARDKLGEDFSHSLGHGLGVEIHEKPFFGPRSKEKVRNDLVFTIEPGLYRKSYGIRIEDTVLFRRRPIRLTKSKRELILLDSR